jgi:hypothetical protein
MSTNTEIIERLEAIKDVPGIDFNLVLEALRAHLINGFTQNLLQLSTDIKEGKQTNTEYLEYFGTMLQYVHYVKTGHMPELSPFDPKIDPMAALHQYFTKIQPYTKLPNFTIP